MAEPYNPEAERVTLGAALVDATAFHSAAATLGREDFGSHAHRLVFDALKAIVARGEAPDLVSLKDELERGRNLDAAGGAAYLASLCDGLPRIGNVEAWAGIVKRDSLRRQTVAALKVALDRATNEASEDPEAFIGDVLADLVRLSGATPRRPRQSIPERMTALARALRERMSAPGGIVGLRTGLADLDAILGGLRGGQLVIVGGQTSMGKSALVSTVAEAVASAEGVALVFSLEMSGVELDLRRAAAELRRSLFELRKLWRTDRRQAEAETAAALEALGRRRVIVDDGPGLTAAKMRARAETVRAQEKRLDLVACDYAQLVSPSGSDETRARQLGQVAADLKALAKDLDVPVLLASQLNRSPNARPDQTPRAGDLRDSGELEQVADVVILVHRPEQTLGARTPDEDRGVADLIVAKNRTGRTGRARVRFDAELTLFESLAPEERCA